MFSFQFEHSSKNTMPGFLLENFPLQYGRPVQKSTSQIAFPFSKNMAGTGPITHSGNGRGGTLNMKVIGRIKFVPLQTIREKECYCGNFKKISGILLRQKPIPSLLKCCNRTCPPSSRRQARNYTVTIPYELLEFRSGERFAVTDLLTGNVLATGTAEKLNKFDLFVREGRLGVCLVAPAARPLRR